MKVAVIGLGTMGMGAALNLHRKGHAVTGCELRESARTAFAAEGGAVVASPAELPADGDARMAALHQWHQAMAGAGWIGLSFPREYGGQGLSLLHDAILGGGLPATVGGRRGVP